MAQKKKTTSKAAPKGPKRKVLHGIPVSPGLVQGVIFVHDYKRATSPRYEIPDDQVEAEIQRFEEAVEKAREQLRSTRQMVSSKLDHSHAAIFDAQEVLLDDPLLTDTCKREIREKKLNAEFILDQTVEHIRKLFEQIEVPHFSVQNLDVLDVSSRIRENLMPEPVTRLDQLARNAIIMAHDLRPSDTARLNHKRVLAIVTEAGSKTSHSAILAKALHIPAVVGVEHAIKEVEPGDRMIVDGYSGTLIVHPNQDDMKRFEERQVRLEADIVSLQKLRDLPCETKDGYRIELGANIEFPSEIEGVKEAGVTNIGLFRSEFFYIDRGCIPSEEEQFQVYREVLEKMAPGSVICRTLDLGGDKFISSSGVNNDEINPFLGLRAIRLCLANPEVFRSQLRAIYRASAYGKAKIMLPFITDISEIRRSKELIKEIQDELDSKKIEYDRDLEVGIMIETPAAALTADLLAEEADFFSIGTNDLIQYTMAVDRVNESVADLYNPLHPSVVHLIEKTVDAAHRQGIWIGLCGEMASDPALAVLLMGMGLDEISMSSVAILEVKRVIRSIELEDVRRLRQDVLSKLNTDEAAKAMRKFRKKHITSTDNDS
ncbi:MAG: phosphoenolpyruvate--protein phosphotransferase [Candidatus Sumerlaeia bacterium]